MDAILRSFHDNVLTGGHVSAFTRLNRVWNFKRVILFIFNYWKCIWKTASKLNLFRICSVKFIPNYVTIVDLFPVEEVLFETVEILKFHERNHYPQRVWHSDFVPLLIVAFLNLEGPWFYNGCWGVVYRDIIFMMYLSPVFNKIKGMSSPHITHRILMDMPTIE